MCVARDGGWQCSESEQPLEETAMIEAVSVLEGLWQGRTLTPSSDSNNNNYTSFLCLNTSLHNCVW